MWSIFYLESEPGCSFFHACNIIAVLDWCSVNMQSWKVLVTWLAWAGFFRRHKGVIKSAHRFMFGYESSQRAKCAHMFGQLSLERVCACLSAKWGRSCQSRAGEEQHWWGNYPLQTAPNPFKCTWLFMPFSSIPLPVSSRSTRSWLLCGWKRWSSVTFNLVNTHNDWEYGKIHKLHFSSQYVFSCDPETNVWLTQ